MTLETRPFVPEKYMTDLVVVMEFVRLAFQDGDVAEIVRHLRIVTRSPYFAELAEQPGSNLTELAEKLNNTRNPEFATIIKVLKALGIKLSVDTVAKVGQSAA